MPERLTKKRVQEIADRAEGKATPSDIAPDTPKMGRPSSYRDAFAEQAQQLCEAGATDRDLADFFEVNEVTIRRWSHKYPAFCMALKVAKSIADDRVERSLYHKASGYSFTSEKIFQHRGEIVRAKTVEHVPPDTTACIFWLKNRRPDLWRDVQKIDHTGTLTLEALISASFTKPAVSAPEGPVIEHLAEETPAVKDD